MSGIAKLEDRGDKPASLFASKVQDVMKSTASRRQLWSCTSLSASILSD